MDAVYCGSNTHACAMIDQVSPVEFGGDLLCVMQFPAILLGYVSTKKIRNNFTSPKMICDTCIHRRVLIDLDTSALCPAWFTFHVTAESDDRTDSHHSPNHIDTTPYKPTGTHSVTADYERAR